MCIIIDFIRVTTILKKKGVDRGADVCVAFPTHMCSKVMNVKESRL